MPAQQDPFNVYDPTGQQSSTMQVPTRTAGTGTGSTGIMDPSGAIVRNHQSPATWRADAGANMTDEQYRQWLQNRQTSLRDPSDSTGQAYGPDDPRSVDYWRPGGRGATDITGAGGTGGGTGGATTADPTNPYQLNRDDYSLPGAQDRLAQIQAQIAKASSATATPAEAAQLGPLQQAAQVAIGQLQQAQQAKVAAAAQAKAAALGPAAQAAQSDIRNRQLAVADQYNKWMTGQESVSQLQLRDAAARNVAQQYALAASARPGMGGLAQRMAAQNTGSLNANLADQQAVAGIQERQMAANQLQTLLGQARGQDETLGMFNAGQSNQQSQVGAQLGTSVNIANMQGQNQLAALAAQLAQQNSQFNAGQSNAGILQQAAMNADTNRFNANQGNIYNANAANLLQNNNQFNSTLNQNQQSINNAAWNNAMNQQLNTQQLMQTGSTNYANTLNQNRQNDLNRANNIATAQATQPSLAERLAGGAGGAAILSAILSKIQNGGGGSSLQDFLNEWGT